MKGALVIDTERCRGAAYALLLAQRKRSHYLKTR